MNDLTLKNESNLKDTYVKYIDDTLLNLFKRYEENGQAIEVSFRDLVYWVPYSDSLTHYIHSYPAKLLKHIPIFFINSNVILPAQNSLVLDPFCGTGTVLLESIIGGHDAIGCDANPLARLIAEVKTKSVCPELLKSECISVLKKARRFRKGEHVHVVNQDLWFPKKTQHDISKIVRAINEIEDEPAQSFMRVTLSNIIKKISYSDPRLSVPVRLKIDKYNDHEKQKAISRISQIEDADVFNIFSNQFQENLHRLGNLISLKVENKARVVGNDARKITVNLESRDLISNNSVDLVLTSPPYVGAQKYIRSSSLSLGWLGFCQNQSLRDIEKQNIGREHYSKKEYEALEVIGNEEIDAVLTKIRNINPLRAHICANYLQEMREALKECYRVLKENRYCVLVVGDNEVCKMPFETRKYLQFLAEEIGFSTKLLLIDGIRSRGLMTKRNKTASIINSEWILVLQK
ncbi:site-specific DNA-methyltransferase [Halomonas sp. NyZ770]|uniref:site-specific DNA-methyltransferase n=1 Tax=Halomonas sp. NyZ770 TaxID=2883106 RepID=UPI001D0BDCC6|nr:site-specific DNA-methyltransferase [Halomonas sp. NyZ770]UDM06530.1 site-specific DNA-methyltransferase [Halomonas sp. NyZ770]